MNLRPYNAQISILCGCLALFAASGCQSAAPKPAPDALAPRAATSKASVGATRITFNTEPDMLLALLRQAGPAINSGGVVLMNGCGDIVVPAQQFRNLSAPEFAARLAQAGQLELVAEPAYSFVYPKGYEQLASVVFPLSGPIAEMEASAVFGEGTRLYNAFAILAQNLGTSIVADNVVAEIPTGEIAVRGVPLGALIDALLRAARATADTIVVESHPDYVFVRAKVNHSPEDNLLNEASLAPPDREALNATRSLVLPAAARRDGAAVFVDAAIPLGDLLDSIGEQLGFKVTADPALLDLPVNYTVLNGVSARTALNLIVRQWPVARFGYTVEAGTVRFQPRAGA